MGFDAMLYAVETFWFNRLHTHFYLIPSVFSIYGRGPNIGYFTLGEKRRKEKEIGLHLDNGRLISFKVGMIIGTTILYSIIITAA